MENPANPQSEHNNGDRVTGEATGEQAQPQPERRAFESFRDAILKGAEDARAAAEKTIPKMKSAATDAAYWTAYGAAFAAVFQWTLAKGLTPESLKCGFRDGVSGGMQAAEKWIEKLKQRKEKSSEASPEYPGPSTEAPQPGAA